MVLVCARTAMDKKIRQGLLRYHGRKVSPKRCISDMMNEKASVTQRARERASTGLFGKIRPSVLQEQWKGQHG